MRLKQPEKYTVEEVVFWVRSDWEARRQHQDKVRAHVDDEDAPDEERVEANLAREQAAIDLIAETVTRIENLEDADGTPITEWSEEVRWGLPEPVVEDLLSRIMFYQSDDRLGEVVKTDSADSPSPPETTTPDAQ